MRERRAAERFELVCRGDVVPGLLWRGAAAPAPLVLIVPALGSGKDAREVETFALACAGEGWCAAALDLPLHGERATAKLTARLLRLGAGEADRLLREEFVRQAALELGAARAELAARTGAGRVACLACAPSAGAAEAFARSARDAPAVIEAEGASPALRVRLRAALRC